MALIDESQQLNWKLKDIARECFYGIQRVRNPSEGDTEVFYWAILKMLGVSEPREVGLGDYILRKNNHD